jgi:predicted dehydrogenase
MPAATSFATALQVTGDGGVIATRFIGGERPIEEFTVRGVGDAAPTGTPGMERAAENEARPGRQGTMNGRIEPANPYARQAAHFLECVASGTPSMIAPVDDAIVALRTALAARDSLRAGGAWMPVS